MNVSINAYLDRTKIPVSIDIGFGDVIYPDRMQMEFPVLLDMDEPKTYAYSLYSVIAEKFEVPYWSFVEKKTKPTKKRQSNSQIF